MQIEEDKEGEEENEPEEERYSWSVATSWKEGVAAAVEEHEESGDQEERWFRGCEATNENVFLGIAQGCEADGESTEKEEMESKR